MSRAPIQLPTAIHTVTVYSYHAVSTRRATAQLEAGVTQLRLEDFPPSLHLATLQVVCSEGEIRRVELAPPAKAEVDPDQSEPPEVESLRAALYESRGSVEALKKELGWLDAIEPPEPSSDDGPLLEADTFLDGLSALMERRRATQRALAEAVAASDEARNALESAERERRGPDLDKRRAVLVQVVMDRAAKVQVDVSYPAGWATWRPFYNLRFEPERERVDVVRFADVWQETGEDWNEVELRLDTRARDGRLLAPPTEPWIIERVSETPRPSSSPSSQPFSPLPRAPSNGSEDETGDLFAFEPVHDIWTPPTLPPPPPPASRPSAAQHESEGIFTEITALGGELSDQYAAHRPFTAHRPTLPRVRLDPELMPAPLAPPRQAVPSAKHPDRERLEAEPVPSAAAPGARLALVVPHVASCRSGDEHHRFALGHSEHTARLVHLLRPATATHAFLRASLRNDQSRPLLEGSAAVLLRAGYFGATRVPTTAAGDRLELDLGPQTSVRCMKTVSSSIRPAGIMKNDDVHVVEVTLDAHNHREDPAEILVQDQVPISADPNVRVRLMLTDPAHAVLDEQSGTVSFQISLGAEADVRLRLVYEVEVPRDYRLMESYQP